MTSAEGSESLEAIAATAGAQMAVLPLLLLRIGTVPLVAPVTNLFAAPLVGLATISGGLGVLSGWDGLTNIGVLVARWMLNVSAIAGSVAPP